jgi:hypothetical protein
MQKQSYIYWSINNSLLKFISCIHIIDMSAAFDTSTIYVNEAFTFTYTMTSDEITNTITSYPYGFYYIAITPLSPPHTHKQIWVMVQIFNMIIL